MRSLAGSPAVDGLDETHAGDLDEVVEGLGRVPVASGQAVRQRQVLLDHALPVIDQPLGGDGCHQAGRWDGTG